MNFQSQEEFVAKCTVRIQAVGKFGFYNISNLMIILLQEKNSILLAILILMLMMSQELLKSLTLSFSKSKD